MADTVWCEASTTWWAIHQQMRCAIQHDCWVGYPPLTSGCRTLFHSREKARIASIALQRSAPPPSRIVGPNWGPLATCNVNWSQNLSNGMDQELAWDYKRNRESPYHLWSINGSIHGHSSLLFGSYTNSTLTGTMRDAIYSAFLQDP